MKRIAPAFTALCLTLTATAAWAQTPHDERRRQHLLGQSVRERTNRQFERALDHAMQASAIRSTPSLTQYIAEVLQELDRRDLALETARRCVTEADAATSDPDRERVLQACRRLIETLQPAGSGGVTPPRPVGPVTPPVTPPDVRSVPPIVPPSGFVRVVPQAPVPSDLRVFVHGQELPRERWSTRFAVSPGSVHLEARARGRRPFTQNITITAGSETTVRLALAEEPRVAPPSRLPSAGQWAVAGTGVAMLGGALATFVIEDGLRAEQLANGLCYNDDSDRRRYCTAPRGFEIEDERATLRVVNNVLFFGGLAAVAGATVWYFVARPRAPERPAAAWNIQLAPSPSGVLLGVRGTL